MSWRETEHLISAARRYYSGYGGRFFRLKETCIGLSKGRTAFWVRDILILIPLFGWDA